MRNTSVLAISLLLSAQTLAQTPVKSCDLSKWNPRGPALQEVEKSQNGFALFRYFRPDQKAPKNSLDVICDSDVTEVYVLDGTASQFEEKCNELRKKKGRKDKLKVVYNQAQNAAKPLSEKFLQNFDKWILEAKQKNKKVAVRCDTGITLTGRLVSYYQIKHMNKSLNETLKGFDIFKLEQGLPFPLRRCVGDLTFKQVAKLCHALYKDSSENRKKFCK